MADANAAGFDPRLPPPWLYGDTWEERAAIVIAGFAEMPDAAAVTGYAQMCSDIRHAPELIRTKIRIAYNARISELEKRRSQHRKSAA